MGAILAKSIVEMARGTLLDRDRVRWEDYELLRYLNEGQREICILRPDAYIEVRAFALAAGNSLQSIPADSTKIVKLTRNMGADGSVVGTPIRLAVQDEMDRVDPYWHTTGGSSVSSYCYDLKSPRHFYVWPFPAATQYIEGHLCVSPPDCTMSGVDGGATNSTIRVDDQYSTALHDYVVMRAKLKDGDARNEATAGAAYNRFLNRLGMKVVADKAFDPMRNLPPATRAPDAGGSVGQPNL